MTCIACRKKAANNNAAYARTQAMVATDPFNLSSRKDHPYGATDLAVYQNGNIRAFNPALDFPDDKHKLIIFYPKSFTPVCETELGALEKWRPEFEKLGFHVVAATIDFIPTIKEWFTSDELLRDAKYPVLSSKILPIKLGLLRFDGSLKRSSVFIMRDGETVRIEHFDKVGRSLAELHRMAYGYTTDSYCAEGWKSPEDGFLTPKEEKTS